MADRYYDRELKCGCMISSDGGGGCIPCHSDNCKFQEWMKTDDYKLHEKEVQERN